MTMQLVATYEVGAGGAASIEFTSIPQDADDLLILYSMRETQAVFPPLRLSFNGSTADFNNRRLLGTGSAASSQTSTLNSGINAGDGATANTFGNGSFYIPNYSGSTFKSYSIDSVSENNATLSGQYLTAGIWQQTAALTSITLRPESGTFMQYSTASLYKIVKAA